MLEVLSEFGYAPIWEKPEKKLADFIRKSLETRLSKTIVDAIIQESVQSTKKPFEEILLNPKTFSTIFEEIFGKKITQLILKILHEDLYEKGLSSSPDNTIETIINEIRKNDVFEFLQKTKGHEHIAYFWTNHDSRRSVFSEFLKHGKSMKGFISQDPILNQDFPVITYDDLFSEKLDSIEKEKKLIKSLHEKNTTEFPTRIAGDNCDRWFKEGLGSEFLELESSIDNYLEKELISCLCGYNTTCIKPRDYRKYSLFSPVRDFR